ncbi:YceI family protein [Pedobacter polaris]|uniref:YceI family protein n=1 Tax=Pedobacter polaris TaxID=2571273 RepID=A0A4U1CW20_9SPHI|nr:YceI family protein [Pedobacter polaris]TKC12390.1 YceI family protein [Pedobacter polaris]
MKKVQQHLGILTSIKIAVLFIMLSPMGIMAQSVYKLAPGKNNNIKVAGTSNVHDWTMTAKDIESTGAFKFNSRDELIDVTSLKFTVVAKSLKSDKSSMDTRTYKSIKADEFPKISYQLTYATVTMIQANKYAIQTTGILTIAGKTQTISMKVMALVNADRSISCHGTEKLMLTDYGIQPPSFMLGAMKVGNNLTISFNIDYTNAATAK